MTTRGLTPGETGQQGSNGYQDQPGETDPNRRSSNDGCPLESHESDGEHGRGGEFDSEDELADLWISGVFPWGRTRGD